MRLIPRAQLLSALVLLLLPVTGVTGRGERRVVFVLDGSGSMNELLKPCSGVGEVSFSAKASRAESKISRARDLLRRMTADYAKRGYSQSLVAFSFATSEHYSATACRHIETLVPLASDSDVGLRIQAAAGKVQPLANTPLASAMELAAEGLGAISAGEDEIVVLTDGIETCGGRPIETAGRLREKLHLTVSIIGLGVCGHEADQLGLIAHAGGGYFRHDDIDAPPVPFAGGNTPQNANTGGSLPTLLPPLSPLPGEAPVREQLRK